MALVRMRLSLLLALVAMLPVAVEAQQRVVPPSRAAVQMSYAPVVKKVTPAVVNVYVQRRQAPQQFSPEEELFRRFFGQRFGMPQDRTQNSLGSGVIISADGMVVTNSHVIKGGGAAEIRVVLSDRREFDAKIVLQDEKSDVAVLKIQGDHKDFPYLEFGDSDQIEVGDVVLAVGNPFGVGQTVTHGIISALGRTDVGRSDVQVFIQTDAAINPGNSGGALVDLNGELIGINTAIFSRSGGSHGIGFAIPSNLVRLYADSARSGRKLERPWLGAKLETVNRDMAEALGLARVTGALVAKVSKGSSAERAGIEPGDVIMSVDGHEAQGPRAVTYRLTTRGVGQTSRLEVIRKGKRLVVDVAVETAPKGREDIRNLSGQHPFDGARVSNLTAAVADELGLEEQEGAVVLSVRQGSPSARLGLQTGDIVVTIGGEAVVDVNDLERRLRQKLRVWRVGIKRGQRVVEVVVRT